MGTDQALTNPPPPQPSRLKFRDRPVGVAGAVLACSTPITGLLSFAVAAILFGETRLEGPDGLTASGWAVVLSPAVFGALLAAWSFLSPSTPTRRAIAGLVAAGAAVFLGAGLWSTMTASGDASIGGALLVMAAIPLAALALWLLRSSPER